MIYPVDPDFTKTELFDGGKRDYLLGLCLCLLAFLVEGKQMELNNNWLGGRDGGADGWY